jgi:purine-binding chemotaxis protein CheW
MTRKHDHLNWIEKLKKAVDNDEEITVETNPHECAFGKWYDTYKANTLALASYMNRFDRPHKAIHNLAVEAEELVRAGQKEQAKSLIHSAEKTELANLVRLFDGFEEQMRQSYQEYAVIVIHNGRKYCLSVDSIKYFEKMDEIVHDAHLFTSIDDKMIHGIGRKKVGDITEDIIILNLAGFLDL